MTAQSSRLCFPLEKRSIHISIPVVGLTGELNHVGLFRMTTRLAKMGKLGHMTALLEKGEVYLRPIWSFRGDDNEARGDPHEGLDMYLTADNPGFEMNLGGYDIPYVEAKLENSEGNLGVYCTTEVRVLGQDEAIDLELPGPILKRRGGNRFMIAMDDQFRRFKYDTAVVLWK